LIDVCAYENILHQGDGKITKKANIMTYSKKPENLIESLAE